MRFAYPFWHTPAMGDSRTRLLAVTAVVGLTPVALYYGRRLYRKYRYRRARRRLGATCLFAPRNA